MGKKAKLAPVAGVLNLKGGVGKTTVAAHVMDVLTQEAGLSTLLIDLDPQFNLSQTLLDRERYEELLDRRKTIMTVMEDPPTTDLFSTNQSSITPPKPRDIAVNMFYMQHNDAVKLDLVAGNFDLVKFSLIDDINQLKRVRERFNQFIAEARSEYDLVCIDCNPSSSFLTQCVIKQVTHIIAPVKPDRYSVLGLELLKQYVDKFPEITPKPGFTVILNGVPRNSVSSDVEQQLRAHKMFGAVTLASRMHESQILNARPDSIGFAADKRVPWGDTLRDMLRNICGELRPAIGV